MDLREFRVVVRIVDRVAKRALFAEEQMVALEGQCAEWKRIADELKAERNAEREALGIQAAKEAGKALGMVEGEGLRAAAQRVVKERDALRTECDDLRRVFSLVHGSLGIQQGEHIGNAIDTLKKERDDLTTRLRQSIARGDFAEMRLATLAAELETERERHRQTAVVTQSVDVPRTHPVKVGEYLRRLTGFNTTPAGEIAQVIRVHVGTESNSYEYEVLRPNGQPGAWASKNCAPCDQPEATHITPDGKATAQAAVTPQPGDVVRLVRVPTNDEYPHDSGRWEPNWGGIGDYMRVHYVGSNINGTRVVRAVFGLEWPLSCVEVVKGGDR